MLARKFESYRLYMAGITQNKLKCLIFIVVPQGRKSVRLAQNEEKKEKKINMKKQINN